MILAWSPWACLRTAVGCTRPGTPLLYAQARATAHAFAWRGSYTARSCANEKVVDNQRMRTCRSQCDGDRIHSVCGGTDLLRLFGRLDLGNRLVLFLGL